jgi:hypothetical protein
MKFMKKPKKASKPRRIYLAGSLFNLRELLGNRALARSIERAGKGRYVVRAPQEFLKKGNSKSLRDQCLQELLMCDGIIAQFDGTDLDSGTVVEFTTAKFSGLPCVALRTDLRLAGDQGAGGNHWNLMCSFWPGVVPVQIDAMEWMAVDGLDGAMETLGRRIVQALDLVFSGRRIKGVKTPRLLKLAGLEVSKS